MTAVNAKKMIYPGAITRIGNSQGIRLSQEILRQVDLYTDLSQVKGGQIPVDVIVNEDCITIRRRTDPQEEKWSQERQAEGIASFLGAVDGYSDDERNIIPDSEEFHQLYGVRFRRHEPQAFDFAGSEA